MKCYPVFSDEDHDLRDYHYRTDRHGYARRTINLGRPKLPLTILSHREVLERIIGYKPSSLELCDHINGDRLDNRRGNLRLADAYINTMNRAHNRSDDSWLSGEFRFTHWNKAEKKWRAVVHHKHLGSFDDRAEAARVAREYSETHSPHPESEEGK